MCKNKKILIVDNYDELNIIEQYNPQLKQFPLILLSFNFSLNVLQKFKNRGYSYFDDAITEVQANQMAIKIHNLRWTWFLDGKGNDLSFIDGCSLGSVFTPSLEILFSTICRYVSGLNQLLEPDYDVYFTDNTEDIFLVVIKFLQQKIGFKINVVKANTIRKEVTYSKNRINMDPIGRKRDLSSLFQSRKGINKYVSSLTQLISRKKDEKNRVLFMDGGKLDEYYNHLKKEGAFENLRFILPLSKKDVKHCIFALKKSPLFYHFHSAGKTKDKKINIIISLLKENITQNIKDIDPEILIPVMNQHVFSNFNGAYAYYYNARKTLKSLKPSLVVVSSPRYENFILVAQAAKYLGIDTALIPHGLYNYGDNEFLFGEKKLFDYAFAFGKKDVFDYNKQGMKKNHIFVTSFPYFSKFLPLAHNKAKEYKKALILPLDFYNQRPEEKIKNHIQYLLNTINLLKELNIEIIGIKSRSLYTYKNLGIQDDYFDYAGEKIPLLNDSFSFLEVAQNADLVIGPASTAAIESGLLCKDYFMFYQFKLHEKMPTVLSGIYQLVNVAFTVEQLRINILNKQPFKQGCTVNDLIDLEGIKDTNSLYKKFEKVIFNIVNSN